MLKLGDHVRYKQDRYPLPYAYGFADQLHVIYTSVEEALITEELEAQEESRRETLRNDALERIKAENPELDI